MPKAKKRIAPDTFPKCPACGFVIKPLYAEVPHDPDGCIVLRNRYGKAGKCINGRNCEICPVWLKAIDDIREAAEKVGSE
jgi:hypothetical protein